MALYIETDLQPSRLPARPQVKSAARADAYANPPAKGRPPKRKRGKQPAEPADAAAESAGAGTGKDSAGGDASGGAPDAVEPAEPKAQPKKKRATPQVTVDEVKAKWVLQDRGM